MLWAEGHGAATPPPVLWLDVVGSVRRLSACVPLPPSGVLLLVPPWEEVQLIGCRRRRVALIPPDSHGGAERRGLAANNDDRHLRGKRRKMVWTCCVFFCGGRLWPEPEPEQSFRAKQLMIVDHAQLRRNGSE